MIMDYLHRIDVLLAEKRKKRPWLSEKTGIPIGTINSWYYRGSEIYFSHAFKIAQALDVTLEFLFTGNKPEQKKEDPLIEELCHLIREMPREKLLITKGMVMAIKMAVEEDVDYEFPNEDIENEKKRNIG